MVATDTSKIIKYQCSKKGFEIGTNIVLKSQKPIKKIITNSIHQLGI